jgi:outer membrane protein assembly factor BamB
MGGGNAVALRPGGAGDVSESQRIWKQDRVKSGMGSGVIAAGYFYTISQDGIAICLDLKDGKSVWEERLTGSTARGSSWSSLVLAGDRLYVPNQAGDVFVLRTGPKFEILATNSVGEPSNTSLAASGHEVFFRTDQALWCFSAMKP